MHSSRDLTFSIITLGCSKNQVDSEHLVGDLIEAGYTLADDPEISDLLIINTCGFITPAKEESIGVIFDALEPCKNPHRKVVALGCLASRYRDNLAQEIPELAHVTGLVTRETVREIAHALGHTISDYGAELKRVPLVQGISYGYLKISEGCSNYCTYCAIPLIRGELTCFEPDRILHEARLLAMRGTVEINLISQDTALYRSGKTDIIDLAEKIAEISGIHWIRLLYCHPDHITEKFIRGMQRIKKIVPYIDIPFQHASRKILTSMGRNGSAETYLDLIARLRSALPSIRIRSTFMTGFPGETESDFSELMKFCEKARLDRVGCFTYSPEEGTSAAGFPDQIPSALAESRQREIMMLQQDISREKLESLHGETVEALIEGEGESGELLARSIYDAPEVDGIFFLTGQVARDSKIVSARVTGSTEYDLIGEII